MPVRELFTRDPSQAGGTQWWKGPWGIFALVQLTGFGASLPAGHGDLTSIFGILLLPGFLVILAFDEMDTVVQQALVSGAAVALNTFLFAVYRWTAGRMAAKGK